MPSSHPTDNDRLSSCGLPNRNTAALFERLREFGFSEQDADTWCAALIPGDHDQVLAQALHWANEGVDATSATRLCMAGGWHAHQAAPFLEAGYSAAEINFLATLLDYNRRTMTRAGSPEPSTATQWLESGLTPAWVLACLGGGVRHVDEAVALHHAHRHAATAHALLRLDIEATQRGVNLRSLRLHPIRG